MEEIFDSAVRSNGDLAGVFEFDGETSYFYLYSVGGDSGQRVLDSIHIFTGDPTFQGDDIFITWDKNQDRVGLFIGDVLWAVFDCPSQMKFGGDYNPDNQPSLPKEMERWFGDSLPRKGNGSF